MSTDQQSSINPAFAGHVSDKLRELSGDLHGVFDNLREIARGDDPQGQRLRPNQGHQGPLRQRMRQSHQEPGPTNANGSANGAAPKPEPRARRRQTAGRPARAEARRRSRTAPGPRRAGSPRSAPGGAQATWPARPKPGHSQLHSRPSTGTHSTTYLKSPTTAKSSPPFSGTSTKQTQTTTPSGHATA